MENARAIGAANPLWGGPILTSSSALNYSSPSHARTANKVLTRLAHLRVILFQLSTLVAPFFFSCFIIFRLFFSFLGNRQEFFFFCLFFFWTTPPAERSYLFICAGLLLLLLLRACVGSPLFYFRLGVFFSLFLFAFPVD